jgi:hypothetical protein
MLNNVKIKDITAYNHIADGGRRLPTVDLCGKTVMLEA